MICNGVVELGMVLGRWTAGMRRNKMVPQKNPTMANCQFYNILYIYIYIVSAVNSVDLSVH